MAKDNYHDKGYKLMLSQKRNFIKFCYYSPNYHQTKKNALQNTAKCCKLD